MTYERRLEAVVVGPGKPGHLQVALGRGQNRFVTEVVATLLQPSLRMPNSEFVAIVKGRDVVRAEPAGRVWLTIQDQIRTVLNRHWDPIGVADIADDEYDMYIGHIYSLLAADAADQRVADYLLWVEIERMGMTGTPMDQLLSVAVILRGLPLPRLDDPESSTSAQSNLP
ncbi:MAG TPA: hypothetical protein VJN89_08330 [Candidatus Acidoferrum sp.]|nr:hypothetical protein [Candidatus Acidoferrum sp.]